ncbi:hypothetical protein SerAS12_0507 [Serratia sp. AS12]|uniref:hypothetical protein n=1 Tax=Serratia TaxID=613 RepID=UPI00020E927C|nr:MULTISPECIES: hypothetical protein [Serratia]AEF43662.1 hypothetical protein SerAS9_0507 [Serratia plymuthica AS9]AEF48614.1 hypothetical protein SerAS12_0507 [Serratia sp. AS12]AEG26322.1 hypothetical protein SerAS13_0507 [Serratia sp. AS13]UTN97216.1 hypothetical protein NLX81_02645 [Serratia plymuthica]
MKPLHMFSEPYGTTGNISDNFRRLLGAPTLDPLQTVIRESIQNIADAAKLGLGPDIYIRIRKLTEQQVSVLANTVLKDLPNEARSKKEFASLLSQKEPVVMEICDFNTVGLGGPTRADRIPINTKRTDFIDFLRNIGTARDTKLGGGTYGFGKVALYKASKCSFVIIDSQPYDSSSEDRRLIGCHIGHSFNIPENGMQKRFTGRHWWGVPDLEDGVVDPLIGNDAKILASALGFPDRDMTRSGTSIMILDFDNGGEELLTIGNKIAGAILYNFWPRMMRDTPSDRRFNCYLEVDGLPIEIPEPEDFPPLDLFTKAMRAARTESGNNIIKMLSKKPIKELGILAIEHGLRNQRRSLLSEYSPFPKTSQHIALMRPVELVVKYLEGAGLPDTRLEWAGVFITSSEHEVESAFADSEPPAHDDWVPNNLPKGHAKTYVNVALRDLRFHATTQGEKGTGRPIYQSGPPLARLAGNLGSALEGVNGEGAGLIRTGGGGGGNPRPICAKSTSPLFIRLEATKLGTVAVFSTDVRQDNRKRGAQLSVMASIALEGVKTFQLDEGIIIQPTIVSITSIERRVEIMGSIFQLEGEEGTYEIRVTVPKDCAVTVEANVLMEEQI